MQPLKRSSCLILAALLGLAACAPAAQPEPLVTPTMPAVSATPTQSSPANTPTQTPGQTPARPSGVRVTAVLGPTCPGPVRPGQVCTQPYEGEFVVTDRSGREAGRLTTDAQGHGTLDLPPGDYVLEPLLGGTARLPAAAAQPFTVPAGGYVDVTIEFDTGIR